MEENLLAPKKILVGNLITSTKHVYTCIYIYIITSSFGPLPVVQSRNVQQLDASQHTPAADIAFPTQNDFIGFDRAEPMPAQISIPGGLTQQRGWSRNIIILSYITIYLFLKSLFIY